MSRTCRSAGPTERRRSWSSAIGARRACGFCLVDTRKPEAPAPTSPTRVAEAIDRMALDHVVLTMVARDDLADGGMAHVAACVEAIRRRRPQAESRR